MPEPEPVRPDMRRRLRYSVRTRMEIIVALARSLVVLSPLYPFGRPTCLTPIRTVAWLVAKPVTASWMDYRSRR